MHSPILPFLSIHYHLIFSQHNTDNWTTLRTHENDDAITELPHSAAAWKLEMEEGEQIERDKQRRSYRREKGKERETGKNQDVDAYRN